MKKVIALKALLLAVATLSLTSCDPKKTEGETVVAQDSIAKTETVITQDSVTETETVKVTDSVTENK